jgi:hypothetical protein
VRAAHFLAGGIDPDLDPAVPHDGDAAFGLHRIGIGVLRLERELDGVARTIDRVRRVRLDGVREARDADAPAADDLAPRRVGHARFDRELEVLAGALLRVEGERSASFGVRAEREARHDLAFAPVATVPARVVLVEPGVVVLGDPRPPQRALLHEDFDVRVRDRRAVVGVGLHRGLDAVAEAPQLLLSAGLGARDAHLEFGELVLLEPEERRAADAAPAVRLRFDERDAVLAERQ